MADEVADQVDQPSVGENDTTLLYWYDKNS